MKNIIFLILLFPFLALAENPVKSLYINTTEFALKEAATACQDIPDCKNKYGLEAYACFYSKVKNQEPDKNVKCKKAISDISDKSFKQMNTACNLEIVQRCENKLSYDLFRCMSQIKHQNSIPTPCKDAISASEKNLEHLVSIHFPSSQNAQNPEYGTFKARPVKTGLSPVGSGIK